MDDKVEDMYVTVIFASRRQTGSIAVDKTKKFWIERIAARLALRWRDWTSWVGSLDNLEPGEVFRIPLVVLYNSNNQLMTMDVLCKANFR